ncbi:hypothetical protein RRG08_063476 [Elysia crispata]|uniref:Uncharacterized protein n=1 Tax=Elysia crispata TaxID=231223 RepID=A0AAE1A9I5_9GAST|nr:hypothetical protein RRG08_063476 [Elysia crispata]
MPIQRHKSMPSHVTIDMIQHHVTGRRREDHADADFEEDQDDVLHGEPEPIRFSAVFDSGGLLLDVSWCGLRHLLGCLSVCLVDRRHFVSIGSTTT